MKRNLPRAMMKDNGSAIESREFACGPVRPGFVHQTTPPGNACKGNREGLQERSDGCGQGILLHHHARLSRSGKPPLLLKWGGLKTGL